MFCDLHSQQFRTLASRFIMYIWIVLEKMVCEDLFLKYFIAIMICWIQLVVTTESSVWSIFFTRQSLYKDNLTFREQSLNLGKSSHQIQSKKSININQQLNPSNQNNLLAVKFNKHKHSFYLPKVKFLLCPENQITVRDIQVVLIENPEHFGRSSDFPWVIR